MTGKLFNIDSFLEVMDHEFPNHQNIKVQRKGYKVDGRGIKKQCNIQTSMKSVDYYELHPTHGLLLVEFSDLIKQDAQIQEKIKNISECNLEPADKTSIKKIYYKKINKELIEKYKDSVTIKNLLPDYISNVPDIFNELGKYIIVVPPLDKKAPRGTNIGIIKFLDTLRLKIFNSLPDHLKTDVKIINLERFCK